MYAFLYERSPILVLTELYVFANIMLVRNCFNGSAPIYLQEICNSVSADAHRPQLRSTDHGDLVVPRANTDRFGRRGFSVSGPNQWNKLPPDIRKVSDKREQFARALKTFLISKQHRQTLLKDSIKRTATAKTSTSQHLTSHYIAATKTLICERVIRLRYHALRDDAKLGGGSPPASGTLRHTRVRAGVAGVHQADRQRCSARIYRDPARV